MVQTIQPAGHLIMISNIEEYFTKGCGRCARFATPACATKIWAVGLAELRRICRDEGLSEHVKWGHPCYMHAGRNIAIIGAFQSNYRLNFFNPALMKDPEGILEHQGENSTHAGMLRFTDQEHPRKIETTIRTYLREAMVYAEKGITPPKIEKTLELPDELTDTLDADPELAEAFYALTPGRQRGYAMHIGSAKQSTTRINRIEKCRGQIFAGKGYNER